MLTISNKILREYNSGRSIFKRKYICYAPFKSLRFTLNGHVYSCCHNKYFSLGKYPEKSIREIWEGEKLKTLRDGIKKKNLSNGCFACNETILSKNYGFTEALMFDTLPRIKKKQPVLFDFQIENTCNLACIMCNSEDSSQFEAKSSAKHHKSSYDQNFVNQLKEFYPYLYEARFLGGEPFLINQYFDIWDDILRINPKINISILTNGTILNPKITSLLSKGKFYISLSIDSFNKETYEKIRQNANFESVMKNFEFFYQYSLKRKYTLNLNVCPITENIKELPEIFNYCNEKKIKIHLHKVNYPASLAIWNLPNVEISLLKNFLQENMPVSKNNIGKQNINTYLSFVQQLKIWEQRKKPENSCQKFSFDELKIMLYNKFETFINSEKLIKNDSEKHFLLNKYKLIFEKVLNSLETNDERLKVLHSIIDIPVYYIISELENKDFEMIKKRLFSLK